MQYLAVTVPRKIGDVTVYILRIEGLSDDEMREVAGWVVDRGKMVLFLLHMRDHNAEWREKLRSGFLKWDDEAFDNLPDGLVDVPVVTEAAVGGIGRGVRPGDDPAADPDMSDDEEVMMSQEEVVEALVEVKDKSVRQLLQEIVAEPLEIVDGPELDADNPYPSRDLPGIEALMFPELFADGYGTFNGLQRPGEVPHRHYIEYCQHLLRLSPRDWAQNHTLLAVLYRFHLDKRTSNRVMAFMTADQAQMSRAELKEAIRAADPGDPLFASMTTYLKDVPGSSAMQYVRSQEAVAIYRTILLMEQNHPALFWTMSSAEHLSVFTQAMLGTLDDPPPAGDAPPNLRDFDGGADYERRYRLVANDPVASQMSAFEQLDSSRRFLFTHLGVNDWTGAHEDQDRGGGEHSHFNCYLAPGMGVPRSEAMNPDVPWHCGPYISTRAGQEHHVRFFDKWITTASGNGMEADEYWSTLAAHRDRAYKDPRNHPAGRMRQEEFTDDPVEMSHRELEVNMDQALLQVHKCTKRRCLKEDRRPTIFHAIGKCVFVLGTPAQMAALSDIQPDLSVVRRDLLALFKSIASPESRRFVKIHNVKVSRASQLHVDATMTVATLAKDSTDPLTVCGVTLEYCPLRNQRRVLYCNRAHPLPANKKYRIARSARRPFGKHAAAVTFDKTATSHCLISKAEREPIAAMQNQYVGLGVAGENLANTLGTNSDMQIMPGDSSNIEYAVKYPHKQQQHHAAVKEQIERLLANTDADNDDISLAAPIVLNAVLALEHEQPVTGQQMARYLMQGTFNGDLASFSRPITIIAIGGNCGYTGEREHVSIRFDKNGHAVVTDVATSVQLYQNRSDVPCETGRSEEDTAVIVQFLSMFAYSAAFEFDPGSPGSDDAVFNPRAKYVGVRCVPDLKPDLKSEDYCRQACYLYIPHFRSAGTGGAGDAALFQAQLMDGRDSWREAWLSFCLTPDELMDNLPYWLPDAPDDYVPLEHRLKPPEEARSLRFGLRGAPQIPLGQLLVPKHARPVCPVAAKQRMQWVEEMQTKDEHGVRARDPKLGAGDSEIEYTDLSDIPEHEPPAHTAGWAADSDGGVDELRLGSDPWADDLAVPLNGIPPPPPGFKFSGYGGYFIGDEDVAEASRHVTDIVNGRSPVVAMPANLRLFESPDRRDVLDAGQRRVLLTVRRMLDDGKQVELYVTGGAGCGKTFTVLCMCKELQERWDLTAEQASKAIRVAASFGLAARNASGSTLGSLLGLVTQYNKKGEKVIRQLGAAAQQAMEIELAGLKVLILEEIGTIGAFILEQLDKRLRKLFDGNRRWGGVHVIFMGDPDQLLPVKDTAPWYPPERRAQGDKGPLERGSAAYHAVVETGHVVKLEVQHRQVGTAETAYRALLERMKTGTNTQIDLDLLRSRSAVQMGQNRYDEIANNERCVHLYPRNAAVDKHNLEAVQQHGDLKSNPIYACAAINSSERIRKLDVQNGGGIPPRCVVTLHAPVMLRRNLDVSHGLVNGSMGLLADIGIVGGAFARPDGLPDVMLVAFKVAECTIPSYKGLQYKDKAGDVVRDQFGDEMYTLVPIPPICNQEFDTPRLKLRAHHGEHRTGVPLVLAYAMTIHKCQGLTLEYVCAHMDPDAKMGMDYVLFSRVTSLGGLVVDDEHLTLRRLQQIRYKSTTKPRGQWKEKRLMLLKEQHQERLSDRSRDNDAQLAEHLGELDAQVALVLTELDKVDGLFSEQFGLRPRCMYGLNWYPELLVPGTAAEAGGYQAVGYEGMANLTLVNWAADVISTLPADTQPLAAERAYVLFVRDVLVAAGLLVIQLLLVKAGKWIAGHPNAIYIVTADCVAGELSQSSQFGYAFLSPDPGFPHDDRWRADVDGRLLSATERGAAEAILEVAQDTEQLNMYRHVLGVNVDVLVDHDTCLPVLQLTSSSSSNTDELTEREQQDVFGHDDAGPGSIGDDDQHALSVDDDQYALSNSKEGTRLQAEIDSNTVARERDQPDVALSVDDDQCALSNSKEGGRLQAEIDSNADVASTANPVVQPKGPGGPTTRHRPSSRRALTSQRCRPMLSPRSPQCGMRPRTRSRSSAP